MKKLFLVFAAIFVLSVSSAQAATHYVSQSGGSVSCGADGTQTTISVATFNSSEIAGDTYMLCGTITSGLIPATSGSAGNVIIVKWESNASLRVCDMTGGLAGAIQLGGRSYYKFDLNGTTTGFECPNNGTGLNTSTIVTGIDDGFGGGFSNIEITNGTIGPLYIHTGTGTDGAGGTGCGTDDVCLLYLDGGTGNHFHNLTIKSAQKGIFFALENSSTNEIDHITSTDIGDIIWYACGGNSTCNDTDSKIHDVDATVGYNWGVPSDATHMETVHIFPTGSGNIGASGHPILIYNIYTHGAWPSTGGTAAVFMETAFPSTANDGTIYADVFNTLTVMTSGAPGDGCIFDQAYHQNINIWNNTCDCVSNATSGGKGIETDAQSTNTYNIDNNIILNCATAFYNPNNAGTFSTMDYNLYYNTGSSGWYWNGSNYSTFSGAGSYQAAASPKEAHSTTSNPNVNTNYTLMAGSPAIALGVTPGNAPATYSTGAPLTFGVSGACGTGGCVARPGSGNQDLGAYPFASSTPLNSSILGGGIKFSTGAQVQ
jgi:hypothetical protein